jgi:hypothetical protein
MHFFCSFTFLYIHSFCLVFSPQFRSGLFAATPQQAQELKVKSRALRNMTLLTVLLNTCLLYPGSQLHQCVGGNTVQLTTEVSLFLTFLFNLASQLRTRSNLQCRPNPDNVVPIVRRSMGLLITGGCDTAQDRTQVCSDTSSTVMQCLRPLCHSGVLK